VTGGITVVALNGPGVAKGLWPGVTVGLGGVPIGLAGWEGVTLVFITLSRRPCWSGVRGFDVADPLGFIINIVV
jgi:hypothetical protein